MTDTWELTQILKNETPESIIEQVKRDVKRFSEYRNELDKADERTVLEILKLKDTLIEKVSRVDSYYNLRFYSNTQDSEAVGKLTMLKQLGTELGNEMLFFDLWLMKIDDERAHKIINDPIISKYRHLLEEIRLEKDHTLSEDMERVLNIKDVATDGYFDVYEHLTSSFEFDWDGQKIGEEELRAKIRDPNAKIRQKAYETLLGKYGDFKSTISEIYKNIALDWYNDHVKIRHYTSSISARNQGNDLDDKTVDTMLNVIRKNNDVFIKYFKLKHRMINNNLPKDEQYELSRFHLYAPYEQHAEKQEYEPAKEYVLETFKNFDLRMHDAAKRVFDARRVDSHPRKHKRSGAFCSMVNVDQLPYVMLNHTDDLRDVFTIAHEFGHAIHDIMSSKQTNLTAHPPLPMCETASIFSEMILSDRILAESKSKDQKKSILMHMLDNQYASINRQAYFVLFEIFAHENIVKGATVDELDKHYLSLLREQFAQMQVPESFKNEWNYIPHIHETPFYCYAYSFGNLLVLGLYDMYKQQGKPFIEKYVRILEAGGSQSPKELLAGVGIDITSEEFWQRGFNIIKHEVEELEKLQ